MGGPGLAVETLGRVRQKSQVSNARPGPPIMVADRRSSPQTGIRMKIRIACALMLVLTAVGATLTRPFHFLCSNLLRRGADILGECYRTERTIRHPIPLIADHPEGMFKTIILLKMLEWTDGHE
jgi:hypothetical protein